MSSMYEDHILENSIRDIHSKLLTTYYNTRYRS